MSFQPTVTVDGAVTQSYEAARYAAAWQDRRLRMAVFTIVQFALFLILLVFAFLSSLHFSSGINPLLVFSVWFVVYQVAGIWLNRFRCPRCGKLYYWKLQWQASKNWRDCRHCGLAQDSGPVAQPNYVSGINATTLWATPIVRGAVLRHLLFPALLVAAWLVSLNIAFVQSDVYKDSLATAMASPEVQSVLGNGIRPNYPVLGFEIALKYAHFAEWSLALKGSRGSGHLYGVATQVNAAWNVSRLVFVPGNGKGRLDLTPVRRLRLESVPHKNVYLVPIGLAEGESLDWAPGYYKAKLGIDLEILPSVPLDIKLVDSVRKQLNADRVVEFLQTIHPELARDPASIVVGVTSSDMYIPGFGPRYAENLRTEGRYAVVSSARLHPRAMLAEWNPEWLTSRLQKLLTKNLVLLYFDLPMSNDYTSLLSVGVLSGTEIDEMGGDIVGGEGGWDPFPEPGDPAVTIYDIPGKEQFWNMTYTGSALPDTATQVFSADLSVGLLIQRKADFVFEGEPGLQFTRVSRNQDDRSRAFGIGGSHSFDIFLDGQMGTAVDLIMEDGGSVHFKHQQPRAGQSGDTYEAERGSYRFNGTQAVYAGGLWQIKTTDGWTYNFPYRPKALGQYVTVLTGFTDPTGHKYEMERDAFGALVAVTSSSGKWLHFENDSAHRIRKVTSSLGRSVQYEYDTGGRMVRATDSEGRVDSYTYGEKAQMFTAGHGTGKPILTNEYYSEDNYIKSQIMSDGRTFGYHYVRGQANVIRESQIIDPNRLATYIQYGRGGYLQSLPTPLPQ